MSQTNPVVLLVQQEEDRVMYGEFFSHRGVETVCAADGSDAVQLAGGADVVVTGLSLPGEIDGFELIKRLRHDPQTRSKPIVVLTSWGWQTERLRALDAGCDLFLTKPCLPADLLAAIRQQVRLFRNRALRPRPLKTTQQRRARGGRRAG
jgi:two-component system cell cycle response regulator DivK